MRRKKKPPVLLKDLKVDFQKDLKEVFNKHNWSGGPIGKSTPSATTATKELLKDIKEVFDKHNWSGDPIRISKLSATTATTQCPDETEPHQVVKQCPSGKIVVVVECW